MITLRTELARIHGLAPQFLEKLKKLHVKTVEDLLTHFPARYEDFSKVVPIAELAPGMVATVSGVVRHVESRRSWRRGMVIVEVAVRDATGTVKAIWFNQPYLTRVLRPGLAISIAGRVTMDDDAMLFSNPMYEPLHAGSPKHTAGLIPVYPETKGLTSKGIRYLVKPLLQVVLRIPDFIPLSVLEKFHVPERGAALRAIHFPKTMEEADRAKRRFAFEELFLLQMHNVKVRHALAQAEAIAFSIKKEHLERIREAIPFALTGAQERALKEILEDLARHMPMNRLLQGDVGSGKTVIAVIAALLAAREGHQAAFMAPTEVLARQHFNTLHRGFSTLMAEWEIKTGLLISATPKTEKRALIAGLKEGMVHVVIGTHALIEREVVFHDLVLVVIDEQHRFGVQQRAKLAARGPTRTKTQINADGMTQIDADKTQIHHTDKTQDGTDNTFLYKDLTYQIRGAAFAVANSLGLGQKESIYQKSLELELLKRNLLFSKEQSIEIQYEGKKVGSYRPDFIVGEKVLVELKAVPFIGKVEEKQVWSYLKGSSYKVALLINFGGKELEIKRVVYDLARDPDHLRTSALHLRTSASLPHLLSMSATPIPRTLSLTLFGDLDLSIVDELPQGRKPIVTKIVAPENREKAYDFVRGEIKKGRQAFVICPRIDSVDSQIDADSTQINADSDSPSVLFPRESALHLRKSASWDDVKAVKDEYEKLSTKIFPDLKIGLLHGKLPSKEKAAVMRAFEKGEIHVLVSTSVIEVGVDVPNASIMLIEGAERFGLSQLYQFRGRIGRGAHQSYCLLFTDSTAAVAQERLRTLITAKNGFELAEKDLAMRGPGQFLGEKQTGIPDIAMHALRDMPLIKASREAAQIVVREDPLLHRYPLLRERLTEFETSLHLE